MRNHVDNLSIYNRDDQLWRSLGYSTDWIRDKGPIVNYVLGGGGGFLKNRVFENFTPPPQIFLNKSSTPHYNDSLKILPPLPPPPMVGLVVELLRSSWAQRLVTCESLALWIWTGKRNNQKLGEIQVRKCTLEYLLNVLIITMFCYCWSLFFTCQKKVHRRSKQLGVWEQYRSIRCMDVDI